MTVIRAGNGTEQIPPEGTRTAVWCREFIMQNLQRYSCTAAVHQQRQVVHYYHANCDISNKADKLLHSFKTVTCNSDRQPVWLSRRVQWARDRLYV